ncbi:Cytochrome P450, putative [Theobroma cacao]|uniref:Cytochrome P450, putative n=1 Tax=Theobroma cacao TaxID=3641 RepID=A0A061FYB4_THECC|nr:Cytochrome P450, putative [Theobroma cacao]
MAEAILKTHDLDFCSRPRFLGQHKLSYNALDLAFSPYTFYWREIRKICIVYLFNHNRVLPYHPIRESEIARMIEKKSKSSYDLKPINLSELLMYVTSTITCRIAFGKRHDDEGSERSRFHELLNETQAMFGSFFVADCLPFMGWVDRLSGLLDRLKKNFKDFNLFYQKLIDKHLDPYRSKSEHKNIIDVLLQIWKDRVFEVDLTFDHIKAVLMKSCPGIYMGIATVEFALANLLYKFDWEMPVGMNKDDLDFDVIPGVTMHKKNAVCLVARKINV